MPSVVHTLTSDGMLNSLLVSNGEPSQPPVRFLPGNASALGLIVLDNVAYAAASAAPTTTHPQRWATDWLLNHIV